MKNQNLITQLLSPYIEQFAQNVAPKASDVINKIISDHDKSMKEFNLQREKTEICCSS